MRVLHLFYNYGAFIKNQLEEENRQGIKSVGINYYLTVGKTTSLDCKFISVINGRSFLRGNMFLNHRLNMVYPKIKKMVKDFSPDIIYSHISINDGQIARRLNKELNIPYVTAVRNTDINGIDWNDKHFRNNIIDVLLNAKKIYMLSYPYKQKLLKHIPVELNEKISKKITFTENGIDNAWLNCNFKARENTVEKGKIHIVTTGKICDDKGQLYVAQAVKNLAAKNVQIDYTVIGASLNPQLSSDLTEKYKVNVLPPCDKEKIKEIYKKMDIHVLVSKQETFGIVYPEALSCALPIIYNRYEGFGGRYEDGVIGYSARYGECADIENGIRKIVDNYKQLSVNCLEQSKKFAWKVIVQNYINDYMEICTG